MTTEEDKAKTCEKQMKWCLVPIIKHYSYWHVCTSSSQFPNMARQLLLLFLFLKEQVKLKTRWSILIEFRANLGFLIKVIYNTFPKEVMVFPFSIPDILMGLTFVKSQANGHCFLQDQPPLRAGAEHAQVNLYLAPFAFLLPLHEFSSHQ